MLEKTRVPAVIGGQAPFNIRSPAIRFSFSHITKQHLDTLLHASSLCILVILIKNTVLKPYCMHVQDLLIFYDGY